MQTPTLTLLASQLLYPDQDLGKEIQEWVNSAEVKEYLQAQARHNLANPLLANADALTRARWEAFAVPAEGEQ